MYGHIVQSLQLMYSIPLWKWITNYLQSHNDGYLGYHQNFFTSINNAAMNIFIYYSLSTHELV